MTVKIQSIHFDADKKLLDFISERMEKLKRNCIPLRNYAVSVL